MSTATVTKTRKVKDTEEVVGGVKRQIRSLERRAAEEDPWVIQEMLDLAAELEAAALRTVARLRAVDPSTGKPAYTWDAIGFSLGITAITAHKRYAAKVAALTETAA